ncbi:MAG TPA: SurA N-terminal domain-containing protein [Candidatus Omnitrophota bacterium]|nr:SurA N-terminal domain-containing protein [Candidatus Omnitrophota bacterium]
MKRRVGLLLVFLVVFFFINSAGAKDEIVAIVNQDAITSKDFTDFLNFMRLQFSERYKGKELEDKVSEAKADLLNRLIEDRLILQEAKKNNIVIDEARIKSRINEAKKDYPTEAQFQAELMKQGLTQADIEKKIEEQFMMFNIVEKEVRSKIFIKPEEITDFYSKNKKAFNSGEGRELEAISLENMDLARTVVYSLKSGAKLSDLAARYPLTLNRLNVNQGDELRKEIEDVVTKLGLNEVSEPVEIGGKFYIFKLINITPSKELALGQVQERIRNILLEQKMQESLTRWLDELKKNSYIKIIKD